MDNPRCRKTPSVFGSHVMIMRFFEKVSVNELTACHDWMGTRQSNGYGMIRLSGVAEYAHRVAWKLAGREIPQGKYVLHICDNRRCVNVDHMFIGDQASNMADMISKGRNRKDGSIGNTIKPWRSVPAWRRPW